jgi:tetratricopeptide (TPR) repeat protein
MNTIILAVRANRLLIAGAVGVVVALFLVLAIATRDPADHRRSDLATDPASVTYRYAVTGAREDHADTIAALEKRLETAASPMYDTAELADLYYQRAQLDGDPRDYAASEAMAKRSLALVRRPNGALLTLAKLANARHDFHEAIELAREHMVANPTSAGHLVLATAHLALGELPEASEAANAAIAQKPDGNGYLMRALVMQAQGRDAEAAFDFARAAAIESHGDPHGAARLRALWGRFLTSRGELAGAQRLLDEALRIAPTHSLALAQRGELALRAGQLARAEALFEQAFAASRQVRYLLDQARTKDLAGDKLGANALRTQIESIVRAELEEGGFGHRLDLVEVLVDRGNTRDLVEAVTLAREEVAKRPSALARFQLARALGKTGATDDALTQLQTILATGARETKFYELASQLEARRGNAPRAAMFARLGSK